MTSSEMVAALGAVVVAELGISGRAWLRRRDQRVAVRKLLGMEISRNWRAFWDFWSDVTNLKLSSTEQEHIRSRAFADRFIKNSFPAIERAAWNRLMAQIPESVSLVELDRTDQFYARLEALKRLHDDLSDVKQNDRNATNAAPGALDRTGFIQRAIVDTRFPGSAADLWPKCEALGKKIIVDGMPFGNEVATANSDAQAGSA